jgi:hypothetical protein
MNAEKTQLLLSADAGNVADVTVMVNRNTITSSQNIELMGVKYDCKLSTAPHTRVMLKAVRQRASVVARLANHLPRGKYLSHGLAAVATPRLPTDGEGTNVTSTCCPIQVAFNNVARSITGMRL